MSRLSSGLKINSAKDDAAGLQIATRMTSQIRGQTMAIKNANDGISIAQTAEGAMQEQTNILQRMRELAVQARNDSNSAQDRVALNTEFAQMSDELTRIAQSTQLNGKNLLDGTAGTMTFRLVPTWVAPTRSLLPWLPVSMLRPERRLWLDRHHRYLRQHRRQLQRCCQRYRRRSADHQQLPR